MAMEEAAVSVSTEVRLISTSTVRHSRLIEEPQRRCHLTPWDLNLLSIHYIQKGLLFPFSSSHHHHHHVADGADEDEKMKHEEEPIIPHLIRSLAATLDYFYPLAGRLATIKHGGDGGDVDGNSSTTTSIFIDCNNEGAEFIHAAAAGTITVSDVLAPGFTPRAVRSFFPLNGAVNHDGHSLPLLSVQATELRDGIFLAVSMNHAAADGNSFWHFVNSWAEIARGGPKPDATAAAAISRIPVLHRWIPEPHRAPLRLPPISGDLIKRPPQFPELEDVVFHFSPEALSALKSAANDEMGNSSAGTGGGQISSLQSLLAFVWKAVTRARRLNPDQVTTYRIAVGFRQRIQPPLPANYFGNAVLVAKVEARAGEVLG